MNQTSVSKEISRVQMGIDPDILESLRAYSDRHGISIEEAANFIIHNFLTEDGSMNVEPGRMVILDDDVYDRLESEFRAGLGSVGSESDWISEKEMREFANSLRSS